MSPWFVGIRSLKVCICCTSRKRQKWHTGHIDVVKLFNCSTEPSLAILFLEILRQPRNFSVSFFCLVAMWLVFHVSSDPKASWLTSLTSEKSAFAWILSLSYNQYCCGKTFNLVPNLSMTKTIQRVLPVISSCWFNLTRGETPFQPNCDLYNSLRSPVFGASTELRSDCAQGCCLWLYGLSFHHQIGQRRRWHGRPFFCKKGLRTSRHLEGGSGHRFGANLWRLHTYIYHKFSYIYCLLTGLPLFVIGQSLPAFAVWEPTGLQFFKSWHCMASFYRRNIIKRGKNGKGKKPTRGVLLLVADRADLPFW